MPVSMPLAIMAKNYSHCPLKKRPVQIFEEEISDEPENLSTKPEDLRQTERRSSVSPPSSSGEFSPTSPQSSEATSPPSSPPISTSPPIFVYQPRPIKSEPQLPLYAAAIKSERLSYPSAINPEYAPQTWHRSVAPMYPPSYPFVPYGYHNEYMGPTSPHSETSLSPPHHMQQPLTPLALRPTMYSSIDQASLSPNSSTTSPPPPAATIPEDLSDRRRQGIRHQCADCGKSYSTFSGLSKHRQFHCAAGEGPKKSFNCKYCSKVYYSLGALKMHIRTHTLPCKCTICGKAFSRPWLLQGHVRTHTGEKPFSCTYCNRAFADRSNLRAHLQTHSDVKKYSCPNCSKTFSRMSLLTKHAEGGCNGGPTILHPEKMSYV